MDYEQVAAELLRALRGTRSQVQWSRRLGYRSNVAYTWESGRRWPTGAETLRAARRAGVDLDRALGTFYGREPAWLVDHDPESPAGVARLLDDLRGSLSVTELAVRVGTSRSAMSRWLSGATQPRLPDFLRVVEAASVRMVDFVAALVEPASVPSLQAVWERMEARRRIVVEAPWTVAVLRALELGSYADLPEHAPGWIAAHLGLTEEEELRCLSALERAGEIAWTGTHWRHDALAVDTRRSPEVGRLLKGHWSAVARERVLGGAPGQFSYNVFTVSHVDFERIRALHLAYFHQLRAIVAESEPAECVAVANVQLFTLDGTFSGSGEEAEADPVGSARA